jgi:hypothetical protein
MDILAVQYEADCKMIDHDSVHLDFRPHYWHQAHFDPDQAGVSANRVCIIPGG